MPKHPAACQRKDVALGHQVAREEDDRAELRDLARLEGQPADADPDPGAVDVAPDVRGEGKQQEDEADEHRGVGEPSEGPQLAHDKEHADEEHDTQR